MPALEADDFTTSTPPQPLDGAEVHLWFFAPWPRTGHAAESEFVRALLGTYLQRSAEEVRIDRHPGGKPVIRGERLRFNLAHSGTGLLVGLADSLELGVDLETPRRPRPVIELARRFFTPAEAAALAALPEAGRQGAFLRLWTCKEAVLKAQGHGLAGGLDSVAFSLGPGEPIPIPQTPAAGVAWQVRCAAPAPDYVGAVAWRGDNRSIRAFKVIL